MSDLDFDDETAALEGYLFAEAHRIIATAYTLLADGPEKKLLADMNRWGLNLAQLQKRWSAS